MKDYSWLHLNNTPAVDQEKMLEYSSGEFSLKDQIYFSRPNLDSIRNLSFTGPQFVIQMNSNFGVVKQIGPVIDISDKSFRINFAPKSLVSSYYVPHLIDFVKSISLHLFLIICYILLSYFSLTRLSAPKIIEVSFGLTDMPSQTQLANEVKKPDGQTEATKTIEDLPQLPKKMMPDTAPKPATQNFEDNVNKNEKLIFKDSKKAASQSKAEQQDNKAKHIADKHESSLKNISQEEYLKRKEEDLRKIAKERNEGVHGKDSTKPEGQKKPVPSIPKSPFESLSSIPSAPAVLAPTGVENGVNISSFNTYRLYLRNQLKLNWNVNEGSQYPPNIKCVIEFTINPFGYLIGQTTVLKSSGRKDFDELALKAVQSTFPVAMPPPKSIHPPQTFKATYSAKGVE